MIFHDYYAEVPPDEIDRFVDAQELGRLVTLGPDDRPHIGLYPFVRDHTHIDLHLVRDDEQVADLTAHPRCLFEVDDVLGVIPSYWVHPDYAGSATAYHRTVIFDCSATVLDDLQRYQPEGGYRPLRVDDPLYRGSLAKLAAIRLLVERVRPKFKLGQNRPPETRRRIIEHLRARGRPNDARAADALDWTLTAGPRDAQAPRPGGTSMRS
jgi:uncharacterized protein